MEDWLNTLSSLNIETLILLLHVSLMFITSNVMLNAIMTSLISGIIRHAFTPTKTVQAKNGVHHIYTFRKCTVWTNEKPS